MIQLMTVTELAGYLRFTKRTVYRLLKQGKVPAIRLGNKWRFDKGMIDKWLRHKMAREQMRIMVIDDDSMIRSLFRETLGRDGHDAVVVASGDDGIRQLEKHDFDLVFLDLKMPEMDGAEFLDRIRRIRPGLPVTVITGYPESEMMEKALKLGPLGVMIKPFGSQEITAAINTFLHTK